MATAIELQQALAVGYAGIARRPALGRDVGDLLVHLADHERRHAAALLKLAEYIGVLPPPVPTFADVAAALPQLRSAVDRTSALAVIDELERAEVLGFSSDLQVLTDAKLIEIVGAVMCSDAQHLALARQAAGRDPIPSAFETGDAR
jgi:predicted nucleic acid-binding protein